MIFYQKQDTRGLGSMRKLNKNKKIFVEVAKTPDRLSKGLMFRENLDPDSGMLFVFEKSMPLSFWGMNTYMPLDIAFIDEEGVIRDLKRIKKMDLSSVKSNCPCKYALEIKDGWFNENGFGIGDYIEPVIGEIDGHIFLIKNTSEIKTAQKNEDDSINEDVKSVEKDVEKEKDLPSRTQPSYVPNQYEPQVVVPRFKNIFDAIRWSMANLEVMRITYKTIKGHIVTKDIEPHKVFFSRSGKRQILKAYDETSAHPSQYVIMNISSYGFPGRKFAPKSILLNRRMQ